MYDFRTGGSVAFSLCALNDLVHLIHRFGGRDGRSFQWREVFDLESHADGIVPPLLGATPLYKEILREALDLSLA
jgi:hypothetical protein